MTAGGQGPEAAARDARYDALAAAFGAGERCYLGHTLDDQAETVLLGLARGSRLRSIAGMPAVRDRFVRPLLGLRRSVTRQACREQGVSWWDDPHSDDDRFARVRVRQSVLPVLGPNWATGVAEALARTADLARYDADALDALARRGPTRLHRTGRAGAGRPAPGVAQWLLAQGAHEVNQRHVLAVAALVTDWHGQRWVEVPGLRVLRRAGVGRRAAPAGGGRPVNRTP